MSKIDFDAVVRVAGAFIDTLAEVKQDQDVNSIDLDYFDAKFKEALGLVAEVDPRVTAIENLKAARQEYSEANARFKTADVAHLDARRALSKLLVKGPFVHDGWVYSYNGSDNVEAKQLQQ